MKITKWLADRYIDLICRITPHCHEMTKLISQEQERKLPWLLRVRMRLHYGICVWCAWYKEQLGTIRTAVRSAPEEESKVLSSDAKSRLKKALSESKPESK